MENYIVSARKYRPSTFRSVVGQRSLTTTLLNAIAGNKLAHAYLFCGPRGVGKTTCARIFAKTINCLTPTAEGEACNKCESCVAFNEGRSYNIHELDAASNNSVEDIRSLIDQVRIPPQIGKYKVYIIDEVHMLSQAAFNAFLKTLEEPPKHAIFILATTEKHKILPTILSRCQIYDFSRITIKDMVDHLEYVANQENVTFETEALNVLAQKADGGMRDALSIFDQAVSFTGGNVTYKAVIENLNVLDFEYYFRLTDNILEGNVSGCLLIMNEILAKGFDGHNVITGLASHFRDVLLCKDPRTAIMFEVGASIRQRYVDTAVKCSNEFLYQAIEIVNDADLKYRASRNKRLLIDLTLIQLSQLSLPQAAGEDQKKKQVIAPLNSPVSIPVSGQRQAVASAPQPQQAASRQVATNHAIIKPTVTKPTTTPNLGGISGLGISLKAVADKDNKPKEVQEVQEQAMDDSFTADQLLNQWKAFAGSLIEEHHLKNTMLNCLPAMVDEKTFEVVVNNPVQEQRLLDHGVDILSNLKNKLRNTSIVMQVRISVDNEKKLAFTSHEKFRLMAEENDALQLLKDEFGLEIS